MSRAAWIVVSAVLLPACGASRSREALELGPPPATSAVTIGACSAGPALDSEPPPRPAAGKKRFEVRLERTSRTEVWVELDHVGAFGFAGAPAEVLDGCFTVELASPGKVTLTVRGRGTQGEGVGLRASVRELAFGPEQGEPRWYDTFSFACGAPGACDKATLVEWKRTVDALPRHLQDPCGSTKVRQATWGSARGADEERPDDLGVQVVLDVYPHAPKHATGQCTAAGGPGDGGGDDGADATPAADGE